MAPAEATLLLSIWSAILVWTCSVGGSILWLTGKFRHLENALYREIAIHRTDDDNQFRGLGNRVQRLELHAFGFTGSGNVTEKETTHDPQSRTRLE